MGGESGSTDRLGCDGVAATLSPLFTLLVIDAPVSLVLHYKSDGTFGLLTLMYLIASPLIAIVAVVLTVLGVGGAIGMLRRQASLRWLGVAIIAVHAGALIWASVGLAILFGKA